MSTIQLTKLMLPGQAKQSVAQREKRRRKRLGYTQAQLAQKAGMSLGSLRRFEQTGDISFSSLVSLCYALGCAIDLEGLFSAPAYRSIEEVIDEARVQRPTSLTSGEAGSSNSPRASTHRA